MSQALSAHGRSPEEIEALLEARGGRDLPQHRVDQARRARADLGAGQPDRLIDRRVIRHAHGWQRLATAHAHPEWIVRAMSQALSAHGRSPEEIEDRRRR
jgi:hypothetical protein